MKERWRAIPSAPGLLASSLGRLMVAPRLDQMPNGGPRPVGGEPTYGQWDGQRFIYPRRGHKTLKVARLVCEAFSGAPPFERAVCMHLDENSRNNRPDNLQVGHAEREPECPGVPHTHQEGRLMTEIAKDSTHWYYRSGRPVYTVKGAQGQYVTPDIRHARKLGLLPGVTGVLKVQAAPGLVNWMVDQALMAALTLPRVEGESLDAFETRAKQDSQEQSQKARDRGSELHTALEMAVQHKTFAPQWLPHIEAVDKALRAVSVDFLAGDPERSFAHPAGFGGKNDWHCVKQGVLLDYKGKPKIDGRKLAYDEHIEQLSACAEGLLVPGARLLNVFVGIEDQKVEVVEWDVLDASRGWQMFQAALTLWQLRNRYNSAFQPQQEAAVTSSEWERMAPYCRGFDWGRVYNRELHKGCVGWAALAADESMRRYARKRGYRVRATGGSKT